MIRCELIGYHFLLSNEKQTYSKSLIMQTFPDPLLIQCDNFGTAKIDFIKNLTYKSATSVDKHPTQQNY